MPEESSSKERLPVVMKFSDRNMSSASEGTIREHCKVIEIAGHCWWAWWRSTAPADQIPYHIEALSQLTASGPVEIGLFNSSLQRAYVAQVAEVRTENGNSFMSPEPDHTPLYYRDQEYPAWLKLTGIQQIDGSNVMRNESTPLRETAQIDELKKRFREFTAYGLGIHWLNSPEDLQVLKLVEMDKRYMLHLSDLHFGSHHQWHCKSHPKQSGITLLQGIKHSLSEIQVDPKEIGPIVVSGDLIDQGPDKGDFTEPVDFLSALFELTGNGPNSLVVTPGNHDVRRYQAKNQEEAPKTDDSPLTDRQKSAETEYRKFLKSIFYEDPGISLVRRFKLPENEIMILQADSTALREQRVSEFGWFGTEPLKHLMTMKSAHDKAGAVNPLSFMVFHHHLLSSVEIDHIKNYDDNGGRKGRRSIDDRGPDGIISTMVDQSRILDLCTRWKVRGVLCGHQHAYSNRVFASRSAIYSTNKNPNKDPSKPFFTEIFSAGSAGCSWRPKESHLSFNLFRFEGPRFNFRTVSLHHTLGNVEVIYETDLPTDGYLTR